MRTGAVHDIGGAQAVNAADDVIRFPGRDVVHVQCHQVAPRDSSRLAAGPLQGSTDKTADVLQFAFLPFRHFHVVIKCFKRPLWHTQAVDELRPHHLCLYPVLRAAAATNADDQFSIVLQNNTSPNRGNSHYAFLFPFSAS